MWITSILPEQRMRPTSITASIIRTIGEDGADLEKLRSETQANHRTLANRLSDMKYEGLLVAKYELTEAGKRWLRKLNKK